jgi:hypothetical protein
MTLAVNIAQGGSNNVTFRNKIINGNMVIDQRNAGASVTPTNGQYTLDRWNANLSQASKYTVQQNAGSVTPPAGFIKYLGVTSSSAYSVTSTDYFFLEQVIEGFNIADLAWGTASASAVTLSFQVYSSLTGTFGGVLANSAQNRNYPFSYTVTSANTWTQISVTIAGDTSGTWLTTNAEGIRLRFGLGVGSTKSGTAGAWSATQYFSATGAVSVVGTSGATFYITGVQLEAGTTASPFEYRQYTNEFTLCQRYYYKISVQGGATDTPFALGYTNSSSTMRPFVTFPTPMRVRPTSVETSGTANHYTVYYANDANASCTSVPSFDVSSNLTVILGAAVSASLPSGGITYLRSASTSAYLGFSAEL